MTATAQAENLSRYHPQGLIDAEYALVEGQPEQALAHLHRQRAILRQDNFRAERDALACQAYRQMQELQKAAGVCKDRVAFENKGTSDDRTTPASSFKGN